MRKNESLFTPLPSRSMPSKLGDFFDSLPPLAIPALAASKLSPLLDVFALGAFAQPGKSFSSAVSLPSTFLICSAPALSALTCRPKTHSWRLLR